MTFWWLSFADGKLPKGSQFLGAAIIRAISFVEAVKVAHTLGINPGGEVQGWRALAGDVQPPAQWIERLMTRKEVGQFEVEMKALRESAAKEEA